MLNVQIPKGSCATGRLLQSQDSSRSCAMCRRSLHFTDLEMYPLDDALERVLDMWRGGCMANSTGSELDASTLQVALKLLATPGTASYHNFTYVSRIVVQVFQEQLQQQNSVVSQARAATHGARTCSVPAQYSFPSQLLFSLQHGSNTHLEIQQASAVTHACTGSWSCCEVSEGSKQCCITRCIALLVSLLSQVSD